MTVSPGGAAVAVQPRPSPGELTLQMSRGMSSSTRMQSWSPPWRRKLSGMKEVSRETCRLACCTSIWRSSISMACSNTAQSRSARRRAPPLGHSSCCRTGRQLRAARRKRLRVLMCSCPWCAVHRGPSRHTALVCVSSLWKGRPTPPQLWHTAPSPRGCFARPALLLPYLGVGLRLCKLDLEVEHLGGRLLLLLCRRLLLTHELPVHVLSRERSAVRQS